jgi:hypothetical protein
MRKGLSKDLSVYRRLRDDIRRSASDAWVVTHSALPPKKLHALGYVTFIWNICEHDLFSLFAEVSGLPERDAWTRVYDLGSIGIAALRRRASIKSITLKSARTSQT